MTSSSITLDFKIYTREDLAKSEHLEEITNAINDAFFKHQKDEFESRPRLGSTKDLLDSLSKPNSLFCVGFEDGKVITTAGIKPFTHSTNPSNSTETPVKMITHKKISPVKPHENNFEIALVTVKYVPKYAKKGLSQQTVDKVVETVKNKFNDFGLWIQTIDINTEYWESKGYKLTDEFLVEKGSWGSDRDFYLHYLQMR